jgi:hypothetical protein
VVPHERSPDEETMARALVAPAGIAALVGPEREPDFKRTDRRSGAASAGRRKLSARQRVPLSDRSRLKRGRQGARSRRRLLARS